MPGSLEDIPLTVLTTLEQLQQLKTELMNVKEFAIDMEVHIYNVCILHAIHVRIGCCKKRHTLQPISE